MTFVKLVGGLGNQLFQVAAGYSYSKKYDTEFYIDSSTWVGGQGRNGYEYKDTIFKNFKFSNDYPRSVILYQEPKFNFSEIGRLKMERYSLCLNGYFQSIKYFEDYQDEFKKKLTLAKVDTSFIKEKNVAFHIRRGDYLYYKDIHHICDTNYFNKCFEMFEGYQINVFTDSPNYVLEEFKDKDFNLIKTRSELNDLILIGMHDNVVCSNSTFSWWGSFLGKRKEQIIVPSKWFLDGRDHEDIYRKDMTKLYV